MDRRSALYSMALVTGGVSLLSRCSFGEERLPIALNNLQVTVEQEDILKELVSVIIPETEIPGAASLEVHNFIWVMMDDCSEKKEQEKFINGLNGYPKLRDHLLKDRSYEELLPEDKAALLAQITTLSEVEGIPRNSEGDPEFTIDSVRSFVGTAKGITTWGYMQSEYVMKEIMPYALVPGGSGGCEAVEQGKRVNIYG